MKKFEIPNYPIGKTDLIEILMKSETSLDLIADLIFDEKIKITSTLRHGLHKFNSFKKADDKIGFQKYFSDTCKIWYGQTFGANMWGTFGT
ncbi:MAG: hypothetical protein LUH05_04020 [Candidatus Gastranaerophilales bacterium]|nr:hypothetical protein [Candidatus Gastranaerophilales bacterium]